jgi:hypothetical protein
MTSPASPSAERIVPDRLQSSFTRGVRSWEMLLLVVLVLVFTANTFASPYFLNVWNLSDATFNFTEKAMIAFSVKLNRDGSCHDCGGRHANDRGGWHRNRGGVWRG